jgi:hypothetical protein
MVLLADSGRPANRKRAQRLMRLVIAVLGCRAAKQQTGAGTSDVFSICCAA